MSEERQGSGAANAGRRAAWWQPNPPDGPVLLRIRVTPKAGRDRLLGLTETPDGPALRLTVRAAPSDGAANKAAVAALAKSLGCAKSAVTLVSGAKGRTKTLSIEPEAATIAALKTLAAAPDARPTSPADARKSPRKRN